MAELSDDVKRQAAAAAMGAKDSLNVDKLPSKEASMDDVYQGPTTIRGETSYGHNYNPEEPVPERAQAPAQPAPEAPSGPDM